MGWSREELLALGPNALAQLEAQGVDLSEPLGPCWTDFFGDPITTEQLQRISFRKEVQGVNYKGKGSPIGGSNHSYLAKVLLDRREDPYLFLEIPMPGGNLIVQTQKSNVALT